MTRIDLICTAANQSASDDRLTELLGGNQSGSLCVPLSADSTPPATHFGSSGVYDETVEGLVDDVLADSTWTAQVNTAEEPSEGFEGFCTSQGLQRVNFDG